MNVISDLVGVIFFLAFINAQYMRINFLTILTEKTFISDQQTFARELNKKNSELQAAKSPISLHSVELAWKAEEGLSGQLKELCAAAELTTTLWLTMVSLAGHSSVFATTMVGQQMALPVLGYVNTLEPEMFKDVCPDYYVPINPGAREIAQAVSDFVRTQRWQAISSAITEASASGRLFREELQLQFSIQYVSIISKSPDESEITERLSKLKESRSRVQILYCEPSLAQDIFRIAKKLNLIGPGWVWIITDKSYTTTDDILEDYAVGSFAVKMREPNLAHNVRTALDAISHAATKLPPADINKLQNKQSRQLSCWKEQTDIPRDMIVALKNFTRATEQVTSVYFAAPADFAFGSGTIFHRWFIRTKEIEVFLAAPPPTSQKVTFEILGLGVKKTRHRWSRIGNISATGSQTPSVVWAGAEKFTDVLAESRGRLRVVTRIIHPFTIEDYGLTDDGVCLQGMPCLRVGTKDKNDLRDIFSMFEKGLRTSSMYNVTCCKGLAMDLLEALGRDVGFDYDIYLVSDDKDGTEHFGRWDGVIGDLQTGAAHMGVGPISVTKARKTAVEFSSPFYYSKFSFLVATTKAKVKLSAFLEPFSWKLWMAIFSALHATAIAAAIFEWVSPFGLNPTGRMRTQNFTLATALTTVYSLFFSHVMAFKAPKSWPNKVLINFWGSFCFIILASYTANHAAIYAGLSQKPTFDNIFDNEDLLDRKITTIQGSSAETFIRNINQDLHVQMERNSFFNVTTIEDAVEKLKNRSLDAFIYDTALLDYVQANDTECRLNTAGAAFGSQGYAVAFPRGSWLRTPVSMAVLKYMETGFVDDLNTKWFGGLQCKYHGQDAIGNLQPRALGLEDFAGVFLLLAAGGALGLLILGMEHVVYRLLPLMRKAPRTSIWHSRHVMFFSQKLYRFINCVDLVSPNSSAREFASSLKQGQFIGMFQKSVKKRAKEEALQQQRSRNADHFFETIHELTRNLRETSILQSTDGYDEQDATDSAVLPVNGDVIQPLMSAPASESPVPPRVGSAVYRAKRPQSMHPEKLHRQAHIAEGDSEEDLYDFAKSFPEFQKNTSNERGNTSATGSLKESVEPPHPKRVWIAQDATKSKWEDYEDISSPTTPLASSAPVDDHHPYTSLRDWDGVDIEDISKQDLIKMWQSVECDLRLQIEKLAREKSESDDSKKTPAAKSAAEESFATSTKRSTSIQ